MRFEIVLQTCACRTGTLLVDAKDGEESFSGLEWFVNKDVEESFVMNIVYSFSSMKLI